MLYEILMMKEGIDREAYALEQGWTDYDIESGKWSAPRFESYPGINA